MVFLTLALCVSTALSLLFPIIQTKESYEFGWRKAFDPYEVTWSFMTSAVWVLYSTVHLHEVTLLVLKLVALVVEACCFAAVVYKFPVHNKDSLVLYLMLLSSTLPLVLIGMSIAYKSFGVGVVASALHGSLAIWKLYEAFKKDYDGYLSSLHACLFASNAVIWSYYGYEKSDLLLMVPNIIVAFAGCLETAVLWLKKKEDPARIETAACIGTAAVRFRLLKKKKKEDPARIETVGIWLKKKEDPAPKPLVSSFSKKNL